MEQKIIDKLAEAGRESADRRGFLKKTAKAAAIAPAVALLLSAKTTPAVASGRYGGGGHGKGGGKGRGKGRALGHRKQRGRGHTLRRGRGHAND